MYTELYPRSPNGGSPVRRILIAPLTVLCFLHPASAQTSGLELVSPSPVVIAIDKAGNGTISLLLKNTASSAATLNPALVSVTDFVHTAADKSTYPLGAQASISG